MHYASHMLFQCIALWCAISGGKTARSAVSPEILANFAKNVASVISPAILGDVQQRNNRSSFQSILTIPIRFNSNPDSPSTLDNVVDKTNKAANYYEPRSNPYPYDGLYENPPTGVEESRASGGLEHSLSAEQVYLRQQRPSFYNQPYFSPNDNLRVTDKPAIDDGVESSIGNIEQSPTNQYSSYAGGFHKGGFGPYLGGKPYGGFHGPYGPYGHFHPYDDHPDGDSSEDSARVENNGTNYGYGSPYFGPHGYNYGPYGGSPFPYGGYGGYGPYGPYNRNGNDTNGNGNGRNGQYGYHGPYGGPDFYGPPGYGYNYGYGRNGNGHNGSGNGNGNSNSRQTEQPAGNGDRDNTTKNGYPYGPPLKPFFHHHSFPPPFNILPYDHFHFKGGPAVGVGHVGYPIFADPYLIGFPFHFPYGPFFHGKKYLPPKEKPADSGESTEQPQSPGELTGDENPERITAINQEEVAPAPTSNRYKTSERKGLKRLSLVNFESRKA